MASVVCPQCILLSGQVCDLKAVLSARDEETRILRAAQIECAHMAEEVKQLHVCVEEQRRVLQTQSSKPKDPGVGIFEWMNLVSKQQRERVAALNESWEARVQTLSAQLSAVGVDQQRVTHLEDELAQTRRLLQEETAKSEALQVCVMEQYRHLRTMEEAGGAVHPEVGLATLKTVVPVLLPSAPAPAPPPVPSAPPAPELEERIAALSAEVATLKDIMKLKEEAIEALETQIETSKEKELSATLAARTAGGKVNELSELLKLNSQRMQAELQRATNDCMNAMKSRDALQVRVYENMTQLQVAEARIRDLERAVVSSQPLVQFARDVQALVIGLDTPKLVDADGSLSVRCESPSTVAGKKKKGKK